MMASQRRSSQALAAGVALGCAALAYRGHCVRAALDQPVGHYTRKQIAALAQPITQLVVSYDGNMRLATDHFALGEPPRSFWSAEAYDASGRGLLSITWDANTGDMCSIARWSRFTARPGPRIRGRSDAVLASWHWMRALRIAERARRWRVDAVSRQRYGWRVHWRAADRVAAISILGATGDLNTAHIWRLRPRPLASGERPGADERCGRARDGVRRV